MITNLRGLALMPLFS